MEDYSNLTKKELIVIIEQQAAALDGQKHFVEEQKNITSAIDAKDKEIYMVRKEADEIGARKDLEAKRIQEEASKLVDAAVKEKNRLEKEHLEYVKNTEHAIQDAVVKAVSDRDKRIIELTQATKAKLDPFTTAIQKQAEVIADLSNIFTDFHAGVSIISRMALNLYNNTMDKIPKEKEDKE